MPLSQTVGECALPLDAELITLSRVREAADPTLQKLCDYLKAVLNSELQAALDVVKEQFPSGLAVVVRESIPSNPERFIDSINPNWFPILCVYRVNSKWVPDTVGNKAKKSSWVAEYACPEIGAFELGSLLGWTNAVENVIVLALQSGQHEAYNEGDIPWENVEFFPDSDEPESEYGNWQVMQAADRMIQFPCVRVSFTTLETVVPNENESAAVPLESIQVIQNISTAGAADLDGAVESLVEDLDE